ncbi:MAG: sulfatase-like hydrolase/transferase [Verrucomicrobiota bacterium]|nr:sulfatase-like hydrolase/transferase [Verrucomicrobiota bacterium]
MWKTIQTWLSQKHEINYLYFSIFFVVLSICSLSHLLFLEQPLWGVRLCFFLYSAGQALLEVWAFIFIAYSLKRWAPLWTFFLFIAFSFILLLIHFTDFTLLRLMDTSIAYVFKFLFGRGFDHLLTALRALNLNWEMTMLLFASLILIPCAGLFLYWATSKLARRKPWTLSQGQIALAIIATGGSLLFLEILFHPHLDRLLYDKFQKRLPLGTTFLAPTPHRIALPHSLPSFRDEKETREKVPLCKARNKKNLYLFIVETLRKDFLTPLTAPHLMSFAQENINIQNSSANANWTPLSWFAIFHSGLPYDWTAVRDHWTNGSIPLQILKQMGYKIRVYTSAELHYFSMDQLLFGKENALADTIEDYSTDRTLEPCDRDRACIDAFQRDIAMRKENEATAYIFFFDGTHSEYSIPKDFPLQFTPCAKQIDYLTINAQEIEPVKNRYRNAIFHIDSLFGRFFQTLKKEGLYDEAMIVITGDHGEEFYEDGALFHGTHLNRCQLEVPIFCRFARQKNIAPPRATHVDIFPSILHYITRKDQFGSLFDGRSFLNKKPPLPYRVTVLQNGPDTPIEFALISDQAHLQLRFCSPDIYRQTELEIISLQVDDKIKGPTPQDPFTLFPGALDLLFRQK